MYTLNVYDFISNKIIKTVTKSYCPTKVYLEFADIFERLKDKGNAKALEEIKEPMMRFFPELTEEDWDNIIIGDVLSVFSDIVAKAPTLRTPPEDTKN